MTTTCPHCGRPIDLVPGAIPDAIPDAILAQSQTQSGANAEIAHGSKTSSTKEQRTYNQGYDQGFLEFWSVYPLRRDKRKAQSAWRNAVRRLGANVDAKATIMAGAIRYRDDPNRDPSFTKYAEGWLNGDGWDDEPLPFRLRPPSGQRVEPPSPRQMRYEAEAWLEEHRAE